MATENAVHALIRQAIADLQPRIAIATGNIARAEREATEARETLAELTTERDAYLAALPAEPDAGEASNADAEAENPE